MSTQIESQDNKSQATMDYNFQDIEGERFICINALETIPDIFCFYDQCAGSLVFYCHKWCLKCG